MTSGVILVNFECEATQTAKIEGITVGNLLQEAQME